MLLAPMTERYNLAIVQDLVGAITILVDSVARDLGDGHDGTGARVVPGAGLRIARLRTRTVLTEAPY